MLTFDENKHAYSFDGKPMIGTTSVLSVIAKPNLIQWSANEACKYLDNVRNSFVEDAGIPPKEYLIFNPEKFDIALNEAKTAHRRKKEDAGTKGTDIHKEIEIIIKGAIAMDGYLPADIQRGKLQIQNFLSWAKENNVKFLASEKQVYNLEYWYAGTLDFLCQIGGKIYLGDVKTSSGIWPEHWLQTSAYQLALESMRDDWRIDGHIIVNLKKTGEIDVKESFAYDTNVKGWLASLMLYKVLNNLPTN